MTWRNGGYCGAGDLIKCLQFVSKFPLSMNRFLSHWHILKALGISNKSKSAFIHVWAGLSKTKKYFDGSRLYNNSYWLKSRNIVAKTLKYYSINQSVMAELATSLKRRPRQCTKKQNLSLLFQSSIVKLSFKTSQLPVFHEPPTYNSNWSKSFSNISNTINRQWMLQNFQCFITNTWKEFYSIFPIEKAFFALKILSRHHLWEWKKIHFSLFQIIALFGCWSGDFIRETRGNFL